MASSKSAGSPSSGNRLAAALSLFVLAPVIGEFLLGNLAITWLWTLLTLAPLYGGGALLIREVCRRFGLGWPSILVLGLAYAVVEEAFVTESLFNPDYVGLRLLDYGYLPALGMGAWWTVFVLGLHTVWSTAVPIAMVEALAIRSARTPWLGPIGLVVTAVVFVVGCLATAQYQPPAAVGATPTQLAGSAVLVAGLAALALYWRRLAAATQRTALVPAAPTPIVVGTLALAGGSTYMLLAIVHDTIPAAINVGGMLLVLATVAVAVWRWSRRPGWSEQHRLGVAAGFVLTYGWYGFVQIPSVGSVSPLIDTIGNVVFGLGAVGLLVVAHRRLLREEAAVRNAVSQTTPS